MSSAASRKTFSAYLIFWLGQILSMLGSTIVVFVLIWWVVVEYKSPIYLGMAYLVGLGVQVLFMPIAGVFVDRWNRKIILGVAETLQIFCALGLILLFSIQTQFNPLTFYLLVVVILGLRGVISSFHATTCKAIIPIMVPSNQLDRMNSLQFIILGLINITGTAIGALLYEIVHPLSLIFWIDCFSLLFALVILLFITIPPIENNLLKKKEQSKNTFIKEFRGGIAILRSKKGLLQLVLAITLINFLQIPIVVLGPIYVSTAHGGDAFSLALIVVCMQVGLLLSGIFLSLKNNWNRKTLMIVLAIYVQLIGYFIQAITPIGLFWFMGIGAFIFGAMLPIINSMYRSIIQLVIPPELQGRVVSITTAMTGSFLPLGVILAGPLAEFIGFVPLFLLTIIVSLVILTSLWFYTDLRLLDQSNGVGAFKDSFPTKEPIMVQN
ncbi:MAG: MFS transporter [Candidatus Hodarchaeales archaeon]|jgi:DHA3 family macrolide efflux protein-like MFS transporter